MHLNGRADGTRYSARVDAVVVLALVVGGKTRDLVAVPCGVEADVPVPVAVLYSHGVDLELDTDILQVADVGVEVVRKVGACGHGGPVEQVLRLAIVEVGATVDAAVEEAVVDTHVIGGRGLPFQIGVVARGRDRRDPVGAEGIVAAHRVEDVGSQRRIVTGVEVLLARLAPAQAQLQNVAVAQERLVADVPAKCDRREQTPLVVREARGTVVTQGGGNHVAVVERVVETAEERHEEVLRLRGLGLVQIALAGLERIAGHDVEQTILLVERRHVEVLPRVTCHDAERVLAEGLVVVGVEL